MGFYVASKNSRKQTWAKRTRRTHPGALSSKGQGSRPLKSPLVRIFSEVFEPLCCLILTSESQGKISNNVVRTCDLWSQQHSLRNPLSRSVDVDQFSTLTWICLPAVLFDQHFKVGPESGTSELSISQTWQGHTRTIIHKVSIIRGGTATANWIDTTIVSSSLFPVFAEWTSGAGYTCGNWQMRVVPFFFVKGDERWSAFIRQSSCYHDSWSSQHRWHAWKDWLEAKKTKWEKRRVIGHRSHYSKTQVELLKLSRWQWWQGTHPK